MYKKLPVQFDIELSKEVKHRLNVETSIRLADIGSVIEKAILLTPGVSRIVIIKGEAELFDNYSFSVNISKIFNPKRVALSLAKTVINEVTKARQLDKDTAISIEYNEVLQNFDNVGALDTAIDAMPERSERKHIVPEKHQGVGPEDIPIPDSA